MVYASVVFRPIRQVIIATKMTDTWSKMLLDAVTAAAITMVIAAGRVWDFFVIPINEVKRTFLKELTSGMDYQYKYKSMLTC